MPALGVIDLRQPSFARHRIDRFDVAHRIPPEDRSAQDRLFRSGFAARLPAVESLDSAEGGLTFTIYGFRSASPRRCSIRATARFEHNADFTSIINKDRGLRVFRLNIGRTGKEFAADRLAEISEFPPDDSDLA